MRQTELLLEFAESHPDIALGRFSGGPLASQARQRAWESLALQLNAVAKGAIKTHDQWRRYWIEFKAKTKNKAADSRRGAATTGGGANKLIPLNDLEQRVMALIGPVAVERLPGVRIPTDVKPDLDRIPSTDDPVDSANDPTPTPTPSTSTSTQSIIYDNPIPQSVPPGPNTSSEPQMHEEWLEDIKSPSLRMQSEQQEIETSQPVEAQVVGRDAFQPSADPLALAPEIEVAADRNPQQPARADRTLRSQRQRNPQQPARPGRTSRLQRQIRRDERVPRWVYDLEMMRHIAAEERFAAAQERLAAAMEATVQLIREIRDDVHDYIRLSH